MARPRSVSYDEFKKATEAELPPMRIHEGTLGASAKISDSADPSLLTSMLTYVFLLAFMFESSMQVTITDYAMERTGELHGERPYSSCQRKYECADTAAPSSLVPDRTRAEDVGQPQGPVRQPP